MLNRKGPSASPTFTLKFPVLSKGGSDLYVWMDCSMVFIGYLFKKIIIVFVNIVVLWFLSGLHHA